MLICINGVAAKSFCCRRKSFDLLIGNGESSTTNKADKFPPLHCRPRHKCTGQTKQSIWKNVNQPMSALGQKQTCALHSPMSALPPKADMCSALAHVCFGPKADIRRLFDHRIGALLEMDRHVKAKRLSGFQIDHQLEFDRSLHRKLTWLLAFKNAINIRRRAPKI